LCLTLFLRNFSVVCFLHFSLVGRSVRCRVGVRGWVVVGPSVQWASQSLWNAQTHAWHSVLNPPCRFFLLWWCESVWSQVWACGRQACLGSCAPVSFCTVNEWLWCLLWPFAVQSVLLFFLVICAFVVTTPQAPLCGVRAPIHFTRAARTHEHHTRVRGPLHTLELTWLVASARLGHAVASAMTALSSFTPSQTSHHELVRLHTVWVPPCECVAKCVFSHAHILLPSPPPPLLLSSTPLQTTSQHAERRWRDCGHLHATQVVSRSSHARVPLASSASSSSTT
jgi:hypothetical protein